MKKRVIYLFALICLISLALISNNAKAENLIANPGFEASPVNPVSWKITGPVAGMQPLTTVDNKVFFTGKSGLRMESSNPNCHGRAVQSIGISGDQTYLVSARFKTGNISSVHKNVLIRVKWLRDKEQLGYNYIYTIDGESDGWFLASDKIKAVNRSDNSRIIAGIQMELRNGLVG